MNASQLIVARDDLKQNKFRRSSHCLLQSRRRGGQSE
jgi:hypothetical protein